MVRLRVAILLFNTISRILNVSDDEGFIQSLVYLESVSR